MRRAGGVFVVGFLLTGGYFALTDTGDAPQAVASANTQINESTEKSYKFSGKGGPIRPGSVPKKEWEALFNKWGNLCDSLTPALLASQLYQESIAFKPEVVSGQQDSPAGARGIAQFMPGTWADHGIDGNGDGKRQILNPADAIPSAAVYDCKVASYVRNVPGDPRRNMLASYNAGAYKVKKYQGVPPYRETRDYVRLIFERAGRFEQ